MNIRIFIFFFIFIFGCLISCNTSNPALHFPTKTEKNTASKDSNKIADKKRQKLSSILHELAISQDPEHFAKQHNIPLDNHRVRVYIFFEPSAPDPDRKKILEDHGIIIEKGSDNLTRGLVPVDHLIPLSEVPVIQSIRLPDRLIKTRKISP